LGRVPVGELQFLRENGKLLRLADLVRVNQDSDIYTQTGPAQATFYAESWLLVHYLFDHQMIARAEPFFAMLAGGVPLEDATLGAFGMKVPRLEEELLAYAKGEQFRYFSLPAPDARQTLDIRAEPLSPPAAAALMSSVRWHSAREHSQADAQSYAAEYESLLQQEPTNAAALRGLAMASLDLSEFPKALAYVRRAEQIEPGNVMNHYAAALVLNSSRAVKASIAFSGADQEEEAAACIRIDSNFADAYRLAASALVRTGEFDRALEMMQTAMALSPRTESYQLDLASIHLKKHEYGPAVALLNDLKNSHDPDIARQAQYFLASEALQSPPQPQP
jgi:tetratricopeptide (TPR) repeat protein